MTMWDSVERRMPGRPSRRGRDHRSVGGAKDLCYPLPRRGVRVVDGAALEKRCAKAPRVRIPPSPPQTRPSDRPAGATSVGFAVRASFGRGRLVDYGAALEMRFGATRRGFESRPLRHNAPGARDYRRAGALLARTDGEGIPARLRGPC